MGFIRACVRLAGAGADAAVRVLYFTDGSLAELVGILPGVEASDLCLPSAEPTMPGFRAATKSGPAHAASPGPWMLYAYNIYGEGGASPTNVVRVQHS
jgi:hypothetical protein